MALQRNGTRTAPMAVVLVGSDSEVSQMELTNTRVKAFRFTSAEEAFDWCRRNEGTFSLVVTGPHTDDMTGKKLCRLIKQEVLADVLLILDSNESEESIKNHTAADILLYPTDSVVDLVRQYIANYASYGKAVPDAEFMMPEFKQISGLNNGITVKGYTLINQIESGGMSAVWEANSNTNKGERVAIKFLHSTWLQNARISESFNHESILLSKFSHKNILKLLLSGCWNSYQYMILPYVDGIRGDDLFSVISPAPCEVAGFIACELFGTLQYIHSFADDGLLLNIQHRDVCPDNLLFSKTGSMFLIDFGSARSRLFETGCDLSPVRESIAGHHLYNAPEQLDRFHPQHGQQSDIFSAGLTLYRLFVPRLYQDENHAQLCGSKESRALYPLPDDVPEYFRDFFHQALARAPEDRPTAAEALAYIRDYFPVVQQDEFTRYLRKII